MPGVVEPHCCKPTLANSQLLDCQDTSLQNHQLGCWKVEKVAEGVCYLQGICTHRLQPLCNRSPLSSTQYLSLHDREHNRSSCTCREGLPNIKHASFLVFPKPCIVCFGIAHAPCIITWINLELPKPLMIHCLETANFHTLKKQGIYDYWPLFGEAELTPNLRRDWSPKLFVRKYGVNALNFHLFLCIWAACLILPQPCFWVGDWNTE